MSDPIKNSPPAPEPELPLETPPLPPAPSREDWCVPAAAGGIVVTLFLTLNLGLGIHLIQGLPASRFDLPAHPTLMLWLGVIPIHLGALATALAILAWLAPPSEWWRQLELIPPPSFRPYLPFVLGAFLVLYPLNALLTLLVQAVMRFLGWPLTEPAILTLLQNSHGVLFWGSAVLIVVGIAAVAEEILFRKVLHDAVARFLPQQAKLLTAFLFALIHGVPEQVPALFLLGLVLQTARQRFHSLWPAIFLHGLYNAVSLSLLKLGIELGLK